MAFESLIIKKGYLKNLREKLHQLEDLNRDLSRVIWVNRDKEEICPKSEKPMKK